MYQALLCLSLMAPGAEPCPCKGASECVREPVVTKVTHNCYTYKCTEFCSQCDSLLRMLCDGKTCCKECHVHRKRELVKRYCVEEKCEEKCVLHPGAPCGACAPCTAVPVKP